MLCFYKGVGLLEESRKPVQPALSGSTVGQMGGFIIRLAGIGLKNLSCQAGFWLENLTFKPDPIDIICFFFYPSFHQFFYHWV